MKTIYLPAIDRRVSIGSYVKAIKPAKAHPECKFKHGLTCWYPCLGKDIVKQFFDGVQDRINQAIPAMSRV